MFSAKIEYSDEALEPFLSSEALKFHYGKHHVGYANTLNLLIEGTEFEGLHLDEIIVKSRGTNEKIFNNASQLFNHNFYWQCLKNEGKTSQKKLKDLVQAQFGSFDKFLDEYIAFASTLFGSGWSWLVFNSSTPTDTGNLKFVNTSNAENPVGSVDIPICVIDLWEHAYYVDYRNNRTDYIQKIVENCINWSFCESRLEFK